MPDFICLVFLSFASVEIVLLKKVTGFDNLLIVKALVLLYN